MTSVDARALAETFGGADPARPLEPELLPAVPALPAGADPSEADAVRVTTTTPLLSEVPATPATAERIAGRNARAAIDGLGWDPDARTVTLATDIWCHAGDAWLDPLVYSACGLQAAIAESGAEELRAEVGGEIAASDHPTSGRRADHDELVESGAAFAAAGDRSTPFTEGDLRALVGSPLAILPFAVHGPDAVTAEVPALGPDGIMADRDARERTRAFVEAARRERTDPARAHEVAWLAAMGGDRRPGTALLRISFGERHPGYGAGLAMRLRLPVRAGSATAAAELASRLNRRELVDVKLAPFVGAWTTEDDAPIFVAHFPGPLARGLGSDDRLAILATFAAWMRERAAGATPVALDGPEALQ